MIAERRGCNGLLSSSRAACASLPGDSRSDTAHDSAMRSKRKDSRPVQTRSRPVQTRVERVAWGRGHAWTTRVRFRSAQRSPLADRRHGPLLAGQLCRARGSSQVSRICGTRPQWLCDSLTKSTTLGLHDWRRTRWTARIAREFGSEGRPPRARPVPLDCGVRFSRRADLIEGQAAE